MKIIALFSIFSTVVLVRAGTFHPVKKGATNIIPDAYIIEYDEGVEHSGHNSILHTQRVDHDVRSQYDHFHGAAVDVKSGHTGEQIANMPGVKNVWHVTVHDVPSTIKATKELTDPEAVSDHRMTGVDIVHKQYRLTGKGVKIGVIDTGIDYRHPAFAGSGNTEGCFARYGDNCRIAHGWDFVGDDYNGYNRPKPDGDPMDCFGHGTHVAGIIGANALNITVDPLPPHPFVGVAPEVTFGAYRVYGCSGGAADDVILSAMEMAFNDGMDVINMSLGGGSAYKYNAQAVLAEKLIARGMALAAAAGNDGRDGAWMVADAGLGDHASSVASFENAYGFYYSFFYAGVTHPYAPSEGYGDKAIDLPPEATLKPLLDANGTLLDGCGDPAIYKDIKDKVVLLLGDATHCNFKSRADSAMAAGAVGMLIQSVPSAITPVGGNFTFPFGSIEHKAGKALLDAYKEHPETQFVWNKDPSYFLVEGGGAPSHYSSFGLDGELRSKPDIAAPGGNILSTFPLDKGGYLVMSGTSMSTPYIAGVHALIMQYKNSKLDGGVIRQILKNTATIGKNSGSENYASAAKQGAGLVNALRAIKTTTSVTPDHIDLFDSMHLPAANILTIRNIGKVTETYTVTHQPAESLNLYEKNTTFPRNDPEVHTDFATVTFSQEKLKIAPGKSVKIQVALRAPASGDESEFPLYSGFIVITPSAKDGIRVQVPYTGLKGDVAKVPILDTNLGLPVLAMADENGNIKQVPEGDITYDMYNRTPVIVTRLGSHTPDLTISIFESETLLFKGYAHSPNLGPAFGWSGRDKDVDDKGEKVFGTWVWTGQVYPSRNLTVTGKVKLPAGKYAVVVAAQRKLTMGDYPKDYEVYQLGNVTIAGL
ncbi:hypothetical protein BGX28_007843 [Mortierella sp. GBA30]|nr:hypothetical protein BGX28_007843 [Mortierella sp. GBA30]